MQNLNLFHYKRCLLYRSVVTQMWWSHKLTNISAITSTSLLYFIYICNSTIAGKNFSLLLCHFTLVPLYFATKEDDMFILSTQRPIIFLIELHATCTIHLWWFTTIETDRAWKKWSQHDLSKAMSRPFAVDNEEHHKNPQSGQPFLG